MYEYRLAFELWGSLALAAFLAPLTVAGVRHVWNLVRDAHEDRSTPLSSVPSTPGPV